MTEFVIVVLVICDAMTDGSTFICKLLVSLSAFGLFVLPDVVERGGDTVN